MSPEPIRELPRKPRAVYQVFEATDPESVDDPASNGGKGDLSHGPGASRNSARNHHRIACGYARDMHLTILGANGTYPTAERPASGYLVSSGDTNLWMDAGPGTYTVLCGEMDPRDLSGVFLSHRHPDHCTDILALYHAVAYGERTVRPIPVLGPAGVAELLGGFVGESEAWRSAFDFVTLSGGDSIQLGSMRISVVRANHPPPTLAPRIRAGGRTLTYTADTGPSTSLESHATGSDLLLAEATLAEPRDVGSVAYHMTGAEAGSMADRAKVRRLMLTHIAPHLDPVRSVIDAESEFDGDVSLAVPRARVKI